MARIYGRLHYSDSRAELAEYKDVRRGASEDEFWGEDEEVFFPKKRNKKKKVPRGCPGNDMGEHVYIWVPWVTNWWHEQDYEMKKCCGCEKRPPSGRIRRKPKTELAG